MGLEGLWLGKMLIYQPGPPDELSRYVFAFAMPTGYIDTASSFPSGHAARAVFLGIILTDAIARSRLRRALKVILFVLLVAGEAIALISRLYLSDHWLSDVVGGKWLGIALALFSLDVTNNRASQSVRVTAPQ